MFTFVNYDLQMFSEIIKRRYTTGSRNRKDLLLKKAQLESYVKIHKQPQKEKKLQKDIENTKTAL